MKSEVGRRVFIGSMAAGVPALAGWKAGAFAQSAGVPPHDHAGAGGDALVEYIARQIATIHNAARSGPRGEHALALAAHLRLLSVYARQVDMDGHLREAIRSRIDREGRNAVLYAEPDPEQRRALMQRYGFRPDPRLEQYPVNPTHTMREAALESLLRDGITPVFDRIATLAELVARPLDRARASIVTIQDDRDWWAGYCTELWNQYQTAQMLATPFCWAAAYWIWVGPSCIALEGGASFLLLIYLAQCVGFY